MRSIRGLVTAGLVTLVVGLILFFPARVAYQWFVPDVVSMGGIEGSIWSGKAREAQVSGVYLRNLSWSLRPMALITGKLGYELEANTASGFFDANADFGASGKIYLSDVHASLELQGLQQSIGMPGLRGNLSATFERLVLAGGAPIAADGTVEVAALVVPLVHPASIGGYRAEFFTQDAGVMASVEDTDGVIDLAGSLQISSDGSYQFLAQLAPKNNTPGNVRQQMQFLGSANERGQYEMRLEGQF
jgi:general secretion pathway protein N